MGVLNNLTKGKREMRTKPSYIVEAAEAWFGQYIPSEQFTREEGGSINSERVSLMPKQLREEETPLSILERKEALSSLSKEAQQLVELIFDSPNEALKFLASLPKDSNHRKSHQLIRGWFGWSHKAASSLEEEVKAFLRTI